jgi:uncharacterized protein (DUF697 family)
MAAKKSVKSDEPKSIQASKIVKANMLWAIGSALLPVPFVDVAGVAAVQIKMLSEMSYVYGLRFSENRARSLIASLAGSVGATAVASAPLASMIKILPVVGSLSGMLTLPVIAGASTYAVGRVFIAHFESGGTFLDFDAEKMKKHFVSEFEKGQKVSEDIKDKSFSE